MTCHAQPVRAHGDMMCRYEGNVEDLGLDFTVDDETFGQVHPCVLAALARHPP